MVMGWFKGRTPLKSHDHCCASVCPAFFITAWHYIFSLYLNGSVCVQVGGGGESCQWMVIHYACIFQCQSDVPSFMYHRLWSQIKSSVFLRDWTVSLTGVRFMCFDVYTLSCSSSCIKYQQKCSPIRVSFSCWAEKVFISVQQFMLL